MKIKVKRHLEIMMLVSDWLQGQTLNADETGCSLSYEFDRLPYADLVVFERSADHNWMYKQKPEQIWTRLILESPSNRSPDDNYDWEYDYRSNVILPSPYGMYLSYEKPECLTSPEIMDDIQNGNWTLDYLPEDFQSKADEATALISNTRSANNRLEIIEELKRYFPVRMYGPTFTSCPNHHADCKQYLGSRFKFYLAFENSNCREYITEKFFFNALNYNMIPIVLGAPLEDYRKIAPPHSFVHVESFKSIEDLAHYLHEIASNPMLASKFFAWKRFGFLYGNPSGPVRLCSLLQYSLNRGEIPSNYHVDKLSDGVCNV
ncbi:hypothetical protein Ciccas_002259 [Cichlidogyrus casuarinus]|uniref:Fucosyltransferase n=1 Tax=Cichlidogyrus casuarinus TaxID=1844966 RepID=A0ABD2QIA9_9PLAT